MNKMYLICGMPGAGKTTYATKFVKEHNIKYYFNIDNFYDAFCGRGGHKFEVWQAFFSAIHSVENEDEDIVVETMSLTTYNRQELLHWFPDFEHILIYISAPYDLCCENNNKRVRVVPDAILKDYYNKMEVPSPWLDIGWEVRFVINNNNEFVECEDGLRWEKHYTL